MRWAILVSELATHGGVGDYSRRLAAGLEAVDHSADVVILRADLPTLRSIDVASVQFVNYSFGPHGLLRPGLGRRIRRWVGGAKIHLNVHETWIGAERRPTPKDRALGLAQRETFRRFLYELNPHLVTTSTDIYAARLRALGFPAEVLPVFSNVPRVAVRPPAGSHAVSFGALPPPELLREVLVAYADLSATALEYTHVGQVPVAGIEEVRRQLGTTDVAVRHTGPLPAKDVSQVLAAATLGICTTPLALIGKSGVAAALREHAVPVVCAPSATRYVEDWRPQDPYVVEWSGGGEQLRALLALPRRAAPDGVARVIAALSALLVTR